MANECTISAVTSLSSATAEVRRLINDMCSIGTIEKGKPHSITHLHYTIKSQKLNTL